MQISVCLLCYGDHPKLARQALGSIVRVVSALSPASGPALKDIRIGGNALAAATVSALREAAVESPKPIYLVEEETGRNVWKYPLMRRLFWDEALPPLPEWVMWFDDDSHITATDGAAWWRRLSCELNSGDLVGVRHRQNLRGRQHLGIAAQPWCRTPPQRGQRVFFVTGGWWVARTEVLRRWDYPFLDIVHNGGDVMLGALCAQQGRRVLDFREGVAVNAGLTSALNAAPRRGGTSPLVWIDYQSGKAPERGHHNFRIRIGELACKFKRTGST